MYTGITQGLYPVTAVETQIGLRHYTVALPSTLLHGLKIGDSVAIDGVCQTVTAITDHNVSFTVIAETLAKTTLIDLYPGRKVSVERSARIGDEIGGHEIAGHVFETAIIKAKQATTPNISLLIQCSSQCIQFIYEKGFVAIDGSSLTVGPVDRDPARFTVYLIPETCRTTQLSDKPIGARVNLEIDPNTLKLHALLQPYLLQLELRLTALEATKPSSDAI